MCSNKIKIIFIDRDGNEKEVKLEELAISYRNAIKCYWINNPGTDIRIDYNYNINCINCKDCYSCRNCINCENCGGCKNCVKCVDCNECIDCIDCTDCNLCVDRYNYYNNEE